MILLLAGTHEARDVADRMARAGVEGVASYAGATRAPRQLALETRIGGFGGADGFRSFLAARNIRAVLDATHPFAARMTARSAQICAEIGLPYLYLCRPPWTPGPGDLWTDLDREEAAADHISPGQRVFLATGRQTLMRFANLTHAELICRKIDPPDGPFPFANGAYLVGRPPFSVADEEALFRKLHIDWLLVKNAGGAHSHSKLDAARSLGVRVGMIRRPAPPAAPMVQTVEEAMLWIRSLR